MSSEYVFLSFTGVSIAPVQPTFNIGWLMLVTAESDKTEKFGFCGFCFVIPVPVLMRCAPLLLLLPMRDGRRNSLLVYALRSSLMMAVSDKFTETPYSNNAKVVFVTFNCDPSH